MKATAHQLEQKDSRRRSGDEMINHVSILVPKPSHLSHLFHLPCLLIFFFFWVQSVPLAVRRSGAIFQKQAGGRRWALPTATEQIRASRDCLIYLEFMLGCGGGELLTTTLPTDGF